MLELIILLAIAVFVIVVRISPDKDNKTIAAVTKKVTGMYEKYAPYSFKTVRQKAKELGQEYSTRQYITQVILFASFAGVIAYLYFYSVIWAAIYAVIAIMFIPYFAYLRCQRIYSEYIFEQIQTYCTNVIMEFTTTQSFVKALEGVRDSGVLGDPVLNDVKKMIDLSYQNGTIDQSIEYFNDKYPYYILKNMHQLFYQITKEGARDAGESLENMSMDIDALVEGVYRDQMDRKNFYNKFVKFGIALFFLILALQYMVSVDNYLEMLNLWYIQILLHAVIIINSLFLIKGTKYYNGDVGVE